MPPTVADAPATPIAAAEATSAAPTSGVAPTPEASASPSTEPKAEPSQEPSEEPTESPRESPRESPTEEPSDRPVAAPTAEPGPAEKPDRSEKAGTSKTPGSRSAVAAAALAPLGPGWTAVHPQASDENGSADLVTGAQGALPAPPGGGAWIHLKPTEASPGVYRGNVNVTRRIPDTVVDGQYLISWDVSSTGGAVTELASGRVAVSRTSLGAWVRYTALTEADGTSKSLSFTYRTGNVTSTDDAQGGIANVTAVRAEPTLTGPATAAAPAGVSTTVDLPVTNTVGCRTEGAAPAWVKTSLTGINGSCQLVLAPGASVEGSFSVTVAALAVGARVAETHTVMVTVAPSVDTIVVTPASSTVAAGATATYTAHAYSPAGTDLGDVTADTDFTASGVAGCTDNRCGAERAGSYTVTGSYRGKTATAGLTVTAAAANRLVLRPGAAHLQAGDTARFTASTYDRFDNLVADVTASARITASGAASCTGNVCGSETAGDYTVTATQGGLTATADLEVGAADPDHIVLSPGTSTITAGTTQSYVTNLYDRFGNLNRDISGYVVLTADGAATCTADRCTSEVTGSYTVTARVDAPGVPAWTDTARLTVTAAALARIEISPGTASVSAGTGQPYTAASYDRFGNRIADVTASTTFAASGAATCAANTCRAERAGGYTVTGTHLGQSDTASLTVTAAAANRLEVTPGASTIAAGATQAYTARTYDRYDNLVADVTGATSFTVDGAADCAANRCGSETSGTYLVTGTAGGRSATVTLTVTPAAVHHLVITPATGTILAGNSLSYSARTYDRFDNLVGDVTTTTTFTASTDAECTANICGSTKAGEHTVTGTHTGLSDTATLTVTPAAADHLLLTPGTATITAGDTEDYTARTYDRFHNLVGDVTTTTTLTASTDAECTAHTCGATKAGEHTITGTQGGLSDSATLTVTPAAVDRLDVTPDTATITAGDTEDYTARTYDRFHNLIGDVTTTTTFTASTDAECTAHTCGSTKAGEHTITGTQGGLSDDATLTVTPADVARLEISPATGTITAGGGQEYAASTYDEFDNLIEDATETTVFSIDAPGTCTANVCGSERTGDYTVTGTFTQPAPPIVVRLAPLAPGESVTATATLRVAPAALAAIELTPPRAEVGVDEEQAYRVEGLDRFGNSRGDLTGRTRFRASGAASCTDAACSAPKAGRYRVRASAQGQRAAAILVVTAEPVSGVVPDRAPTATLPATGSTTTWWQAPTGLLMLATGVGCVWFATRRRRGTAG
ncbi:hypothetical protein KG112_08360 [Nocardioides sp. zg-ZUI104]|uniref:hypothetical protein n=1 Tax=Nocardioides faecalis TaxID=2803858 RepID=UPI001BD090AE|nr:hypothetical protein [Nocardioides faecalis]MBS4752816.1 hypothetical protein [Nocardioides faecalis]